MRQHHLNSIAQACTYTPSKDMLQRPPTRRNAPRARLASFILGFAFGTAVALLLALLSAWLFPSRSAVGVLSGDQARVWTLAPGEVEELGLSAALRENPLGRF